MIAKTPINIVTVVVRNIAQASFRTCSKSIATTANPRWLEYWRTPSNNLLLKGKICTNTSLFLIFVCTTISNPELDA